jgi:mannose-6-phosphate isomerase-like protein (cupin superfamily)
MRTFPAQFAFRLSSSVRRPHRPRPSTRGTGPPSCENVAPLGTAGAMNEALVVHDSEVPLEHWSDPVRGDVGFRTLLGGATTRADFTVGVTELAPGGWLGRHQHEPAEVYYVLRGTGVVTIAGAERRIGTGAAVFIPGDTEHAVRNTGEGPLHFLYVFAVASFEEVEYRFEPDS